MMKPGQDSKPHEGADIKLPELGPDQAARIKLLRRDIGNLLFHFTRGTYEPVIREMPNGESSDTMGTAGVILDSILTDAALRGTSTYIQSEENCICFTEAPLHEFSTLFRLNELAAQKDERPRYEPYGIAVNKQWLFSQGGRPTIYDHPDSYEALPDHLRHRFVPYDPVSGLDYTWEREWRVRTDSLKLNPSKALVVVPTADEAAGIVHSYVDWEPETDYTLGGPVPIWLAISLDVFGFELV